jgi:hypothetical protein
MHYVHSGQKFRSIFLPLKMRLSQPKQSTRIMIWRQVKRP